MSDPPSACPDEATLVGFAEGLLTEADRERLEAHLDSCSVCREIVGAAATSQALVDESPVGRTHAGRYVVLEQVGRGAMGRVLRAYDPELHREVALKEILGVKSERAKARLVAEARGMARVSHPNVVAVYDVLSDDEVLVVMEYVAGQSFAQWIEESKPSWREVLRRYRAAGQGLVAAHAAGLLHRDFKPANVLIAGDAVKVADFGLVQVVEDAPSTLSGPRTPAPTGELEASPDKLTQTGTTVGTPAYMAPEQHLSEPLTEAADQYAFCIALWKGLCGELPFRGSGLWRAKKEGPPAWPNAAVPRRVVDAIRRGLAPVPEDRWPSMMDLLEGLAYEGGRQRWRRGAAIAGVGLVGVAAVMVAVARRPDVCSGAGRKLAGVWDAAQRDVVKGAIAATGVAYGAEVWTRVQVDLDEYAEAWAAMHESACRATTVDGVQSEEVLDLRMACLDRAQRELAATSEILVTADADLVGKAHELSGGLPALSRCADVEALLAEVEPPPSEEAQTVGEIRARLATAAAARRAGRYEDAKREVDAAAELVGGVEYVPVEAEVAVERGRVLQKMGEYDEARAALEDGLRLSSTQRDTETMYEAAILLLHVVGVRQERFDEATSYLDMARGLAAGDRRREATVSTSHAGVLIAQGKYNAAIVEARRAVALREEVLGPDHPDTATSRLKLAGGLESLERNDEAEAELRKALASTETMLGPNHPNVAGIRTTLANAFFGMGKYAESEAESRGVIELRERVLPAGHPDIAAARSTLGIALYAQAKYPEAEATLRRALVEAEAALGPGSSVVAVARNNLASTLIAQKKFEEAEAAYREAAEVTARVLGPEHAYTQQAQNNLANVLIEQGNYAAGEALHREILARREQALGPEHPVVAESHTNLGFVLREQGRHKESEAEFRAALAIRIKSQGDDHLEVARSRTHLANQLHKMGNAPEACDLGRAAWRRWKKDDIPHGERPDAAFVAAKACLKAGNLDRAEAKTLAKEARRGYAATDQEGRVKAVDAWLADL